MKKIDVLVSSGSQYGVLNHFSKQLHLALLTEGFESRLLENDDVIKIPLSDPPDLTIGFNGVPQHPSGLFLCDLIERPHVCYLVDLAYRYFYLIESPYILMACNDHLSCTLFQQRGLQKAFFLPPAADDGILLERRDRIYDVVLLATFIDFEGRRNQWPKIFTPPIVQAMNTAIDIVFSDEVTSFIEAFQIAINQQLEHGRTIQLSQKILEESLHHLELYVRGKDRVDLVRSIRDVPIHVFDGTIDTLNWKNYLKGKQSNIIFHPPVSYEENLKIMQQSKIVLNSSPHIRQGAHERVFNALACGALTLTNENGYMPHLLLPNRDAIYFTHANLAKVEGMISEYLTDHNKREDVIQHGQRLVLESQTWKNRVKELVNYLTQVVHID